MSTLNKAEVRRQIRILTDKSRATGLSETEREDFDKLCTAHEAMCRAEAQPKRSTATDLPGIIREIRRLGKMSHRTAPEDVRFHALCARSKTLHEAERATEARAAKRSARTTTPTDGRKSLDTVTAEIKRISSKGDSMTVAEDRYLKQLRSDLVTLTTAKRNADATALMERARDKQRQVRTRRIAADPSDIDPTRATRSELRDGALRVLERESAAMTPSQLDHAEGLVRDSTDNRDASDVARWILMTESAAYRSAFWNSLQYATPTFTAAESFAVNRFRQWSASEDRAAAESGSFGLAIPATIDPSIVPSAGELAPIVQLCNRATVTSNVYKSVASAGSAWAFQTEGAVVGDETPTLAQPVLDIYTARSFVPASIELTEDYPAWQAEIAKVLGRGYIDLLSQKSAVGSGTGEPTGLFTRMANTTTSPAHVTVTTAGHIGAVDVRATWSALPQRFRASSTWVMHEDVLSQVRNIAGAASQVDLVVDRQGTTLMGRPVLTSSYCPDFTGTTGSENFLVLGDLSGYTLATRLGMTVELVNTMRDSTGRPVGQRGYLAYARVGADATVPTAMVLLANS